MRWPSTSRYSATLCVFSLRQAEALEVSVSAFTLHIEEKLECCGAQVAEGLEAPVQLLYLLTLLGFLAAGAYLVVRQVLIRRELEEAAKVLGERIRTGDAAAEVRLKVTQHFPTEKSTSGPSQLTVREFKGLSESDDATAEGKGGLSVWCPEPCQPARGVTKSCEAAARCCIP